MVDRVLSANEVKSWFDASGTTVTDWAKAHGFPREIVYALLSGRIRGRRGMAHEAAVALRLKAIPKPLLEEQGNTAGTRLGQPLTGEELEMA